MYFHLSYLIHSKNNILYAYEELDYTISIPPLKSRSLKERYNLIEMFLNQEAKQINVLFNSQILFYILYCFMNVQDKLRN